MRRGQGLGACSRVACSMLGSKDPNTYSLKPCAIPVTPSRLIHMAWFLPFFSSKKVTHALCSENWMKYCASALSKPLASDSGAAECRLPRMRHSDAGSKEAGKHVVY